MSKTHFMHDHTTRLSRNEKLNSKPNRYAIGYYRLIKKVKKLISLTINIGDNHV